MKPCFVTGATGFVGGHLARRLLADRRDVRCLVRDPSRAAALVDSGAELVHGELGSGSPPDLSGVDTVFHCAAMVSDWGTREEIHRANVTGTKEMLDAAVLAKARRFVHVSTTDVYGYPGGFRVTEETVTSPAFKNWYSATKIDAERAVSRCRAQHQLDVVIARPATVYGPESKNALGEIGKALAAGQMILVAGGRANAGLAFVSNVVDALLLLASADGVSGEAFNISDDLEVSWKTFLSDLAERIGVPPPRIDLPYAVALGLARGLESGYRGLRRMTGFESAALLSRQAVQVMGIDQSFSIDKARTRLGYQPEVGYEEGLNRSAKWLQEIIEST